MIYEEATQDDLTPTRNRIDGVITTIEQLLAEGALSSSMKDGNSLDVDAENPDGGQQVNAEGDVEVDPMEQIRGEIALLRKQVGIVDNLQTQIAMLPGKEAIVSAVLARIPVPKCTCNDERDEINRPLDEFDPRI